MSETTGDPRIEAGIDGGNEAGNDSGIEAGNDSGIEAGTDSGIDSGIDSGTDSGIEAGTDSGNDGGNEAGIDGGDEAAIDSGIEAGNDGGNEAGNEAGIEIDGNDGTGKTTLVRALSRYGIIARDRGAMTRATDDPSVEPQPGTRYILLDAPIEVCRARLAAAGKDLDERYHRVEDLRYYRAQFLALVRPFGATVLAAEVSREALLLAALEAIRGRPLRLAALEAIRGRPLRLGGNDPALLALRDPMEGNDDD